MLSKQRSMKILKCQPFLKKQIDHCFQIITLMEQTKNIGLTKSKHYFAVNCFMQNEVLDVKYLKVSRENVKAVQSWRVVGQIEMIDTLLAVS